MRTPRSTAAPGSDRTASSAGTTSTSTSTSSRGRDNDRDVSPSSRRHRFSTVFRWQPSRSAARAADPPHSSYASSVDTSRARSAGSRAGRGPKTSPAR